MTDEKKPDLVGVPLLTKTGLNATLSYQMGLIMLHTDNVCAQWHPDNVSVQVYKFLDHVKVAFNDHSQADQSMINNYQSFYFLPEHYESICELFRMLRFPEQCYIDLSKNLE